MMKMNFALPLFALMVLLGACSQDKTPTTAAATSTPVIGTDYTELADGRKFQPDGGKIEVVEVFGYTCSHCAHLEPALAEWKARLPQDVELTYVPGVFGGYWNDYARAYYAADALGALNKTHAATFKALHQDNRLPPTGSNAEIVGDYYAGLGVDKAAFVAAYNSPETEAKLKHALEFAMANKVAGTPVIIVDGRYSVALDSRGPEHMFRTIDWLIGQQRAANTTIN
jgi:thiol:disulfide interchange protein DsbA